MRIEVDQSGRIGDTKVPTVLAFSNQIRKFIFIPAPVKRECVQRLRRRKKFSPSTYLELFAAGLFLLLKEDLSQLTAIIIDIEFVGHEDALRGMLLRHIRKRDPSFPKDRITFRRIGKRSRAHALAYGVYHEYFRTRRLNPSWKVIKTRELYTLVR